ncbi:flagellar basal body-associated FliL family protein [Clostridium cellulovorans]|uniref:Flagellar protein FliL n=1 Tax=Clostridium cellulovorans (strain ATCC 35296 / DSM 3052 / OCM 3 / 743B) TaxID=573061 RepID=D9SKH4_CLOC7|nr:flagellar basal body-associated FliL family protein [Clostridium cellulovorans]ADL51470.1 flagellar basal body-associated protein FliL [Clostridium cellulovorans 743B]
MSEKNENAKKGGFSKILIGLLLAIVLVGAAFATAYFYFTKSAEKVTQKTVHPLAHQVTYSLDEFKLNLSEPKTYIQTKISLGYDGGEESEEFAKELETKKTIIRDAVITLIRTKTNTDFTKEGTETLKIQIINTVNPLLEKGEINHVYFDSIIIQ